jgi:hypothetical protein
MGRKVKMKYSMLLIAAGAVLAIGGADAQTPRAAPNPAQAGPAPVKAAIMMSAVMPSTDFERSKTFYVKGLGFTTFPAANPRELVVVFPGGGSSLMLNLVKPGERPPGRAILQVPDMKAFVAGLAAAGFAMEGKINELAQYHIALGNVKDPDGNAFEVIARLP